jgi:hypothetical protein
MAIVRAILALFVWSCTAAGNSIILQSVDTPLGEQQTLWINEQGTATQLFWAGGINASVDGHARVLWCVQLFVNIGLNTTYNTVVDWADTPQLQRVGWLMQNVVGGVTTQAQGAAFQIAIWDIVEDNGDGFNSGKVAKSSSSSHPTDPTVLNLAIQYETLSQGKLFKYAPVYHNVKVSDGSAVQNLMGPLAYDGGVLGQAPEPGDGWMTLGGCALIALARYGRYLRMGSRRSPSVSIR